MIIISITKAKEKNNTVKSHQHDSTENHIFDTVREAELFLSKKYTKAGKFKIFKSVGIGKPLFCGCSYYYLNEGYTYIDDVYFYEGKLMDLSKGVY